jgi:hypothetical protein
MYSICRRCLCCFFQSSSITITSPIVRGTGTNSPSLVISIVIRRPLTTSSSSLIVMASLWAVPSRLTCYRMVEAVRRSPPGQSYSSTHSTVAGPWLQVQSRSSSGCCTVCSSNVDCDFIVFLIALFETLHDQPLMRKVLENDNMTQCICIIDDVASAGIHSLDVNLSTRPAICFYE